MGSCSYLFVTSSFQFSKESSSCKQTPSLNASEERRNQEKKNSFLYVEEAPSSLLFSASLSMLLKFRLIQNHVTLKGVFVLSLVTRSPFSFPSLSLLFLFFFITRATLLIIQVRFFPTRNMGQNKLKAKREIAFKLGERCARYQWRVKIRLG